MRTLALAILPLLAAPPAMDGHDCREKPSAVRELGNALKDASGEWYENVRLPYRGGWLDTRAALDGLTQQDRLRWTRHDDEKCGAMVGLAAAIVGGRETFGELLSRLEKRSAFQFRPKLAQARERFEKGTLTAGDLHRVGEVLYSTYVGGRDGSSDGDISRMVRASGYSRVATGAKTPRELLEKARPGDVFPLNVYLEQPEFIGWHVVLVWKDADGVAHVYDSDKDVADGQVFTEGGAGFAERYLDWVAPAEKIPAEWKPGTLYR